MVASRGVQSMSALPPKADIAVRDWDVRFVPKPDVSNCSKISYSNTSSARFTNGDLPRPSVLKALRLMTKSNFVGCKAGRSAGLSASAYWH
jgi:hypothetical protein